MRRWKRTMSIVMAVVVVFSFVIPHFGNDRVEAASSDNLTGWRLGDTTVLNGNQEEGWRIDFNGEQYINNGTSYETNIGVSKLQVAFNLSELAIGKTIILQLADRKSEFRTNTHTVVNFVFERRAEGTLFFYDLGQMANTHLMEHFDFSGNHVFEFVQEKGKWMPVLDGVVLSDGEKAEVNAFYDTFVKTMSGQFLEKTTVSFAPVSTDGTILTIRNIGFIEKALDITGWTPGATSALYGGPTEGWKVDFYGARYESNGSSYEANIDISKLQVNFNLSEVVQGQGVILQLGDARGDFDKGAPARVNFLLSKADDRTLLFHGLDVDKFPGEQQGVFNFHWLYEFDFETDHKFAFVQENGIWLPALDGQILKGDAQTNAVYDNFVKTMSLQFAGKTTVSFAPNGELNSTEMITITDINFVRNKVEPGDIDWAGALVTGDSKTGYEIVNRQHEWSYSTKKLDAAEVTMQAKLSLDVGTWIALELSDGTERTLLPTQKELLDQKRMMFLLGRQPNGTDLRVSLWSGVGELLLGVIQDFDFGAVHTFALRQMDNAYYMVIDGDAYGSAYQDEMKKYAENIQSGSEGKVYYRFFGSEVYGVQAVRFLVKGDLDGDYDRTESDVSILRKKLAGAEAESYGLEDVNEDKQFNVADLVCLMKLTETASVWSSGASMEDDSVLVHVRDYGAVGDGRTNDMQALAKALDMVKRLSERSKVILQFEPNTEYYFKTRNGESAIVDLVECSNITLRGENTTIIMDKSPDPVSGEARLVTYVNVDSSENIAIEGFNFKFSQPWYTMASVTGFHKDSTYIDITTEHSLGITGTYAPTNRTAFGLPYTGGDSRNHMYIDRIEPIDPGTKRYRVYFQDWDDIREKMDFMQRNNLRFILGIPYWDRGEASDGTGAVIVTGTTNLNMKDINVWAASSFVFHMRNNYGNFNIRNCNVTTEPGAGDQWASQVDIFHLKENRCKFLIEDCLLEKANDDVFNLSTTYLRVDSVTSNTEFNMLCDEFGGAYYMPLRAGDTITLINERTGEFVGRTRIKEVLEQSYTANRVITEDPLPLNQKDVGVFVDSMGQPGSVIRNCTIDGTYRFRTPIMIENCTLNTLYAWIDNIPQVEGPLPMDITFRSCIFHARKVSDREMCYMSPDYMMQLGTTCNLGSGVQPKYFAENIVFDNCEIDPNLIDFMNNTADVSFVRNGREYDRRKPQ